MSKCPPITFLTSSLSCSFLLKVSNSVLNEEMKSFSRLPRGKHFCHYCEHYCFYFKFKVAFYPRPSEGSSLPYPTTGITHLLPMKNHFVAVSRIWNPLLLWIQLLKVPLQMLPRATVFREPVFHLQLKRITLSLNEDIKVKGKCKSWEGRCSRKGLFNSGRYFHLECPLFLNCSAQCLSWTPRLIAVGGLKSKL